MNPQAKMSGATPPPPSKEKSEPESFFQTEEWPVWRDKILKHVATACFLNRDLRRLPAVLRKVRDGKRLTIREAGCLSSSIMGVAYFAGMAIARGLVAGRDADELERRYYERLRKEPEATQ